MKNLKAMFLVLVVGLSVSPVAYGWVAYSTTYYPAPVYVERYYAPPVVTYAPPVVETSSIGCDYFSVSTTRVVEPAPVVYAPPVQTVVYDTPVVTRSINIGLPSIYVGPRHCRSVYVGPRCGPRGFYHGHYHGGHHVARVRFHH